MHQLRGTYGVPPAGLLSLVRHAQRNIAIAGGAPAHGRRTMGGPVYGLWVAPQLVSIHSATPS
eukprot:715591-Lingulodinium_polyedra.AAC.1